MQPDNHKNKEKKEKKEEKEEKEEKEQAKLGAWCVRLLLLREKKALPVYYAQ